MIALRLPNQQSKLSPTMSWRQICTQRAADYPEIQNLSPAEQVVLDYLCQGLSNKEIARALGKSTYTVKNQVHACLIKFGLPSRGRLIAVLR